ncbi:MAG: pyruvate:ferredoxin (flavodoxin) oxidoreductase [Oscillospiraceae bacterium]|nr:pyruvate:ferredoxin (flavodoxin) oxidoreductase [Oscillospiraceae bacterium]
MARKMLTMDGNQAAAHVSYAFTDVAAIYPITPSSVMAEHVDEWSAKGRKNLFGNTVQVAEMQSEAGAAGAVHGSLAAGALTTTFTASQGLLLMIPNMYKIAGELLPCVINVSARALATHALSIFGDHSDVLACRQTGFAMLASGSVQEVMDLTAVSHLSAIKGRVPFLNFFDGFRTSHEIQKVEVWDYEDLGEMLDWNAVSEFRHNALNPEHPVTRGTAQNPDIFFQAKEAANPFYNRLPEVVEGYMNEVNKRIGTDYKLFNYYGAEDAETVIVAMGSVTETAQETIDYLTAKGEKVGLVKVHLYRPFSTAHLLNVIPNTTKTLVVLDRTKEPGALGEPLYLDVCSALRGSKFADVRVVGGRYGLGSKDTTPAQIIAAFRNGQAAEPKLQFTLGIVDDVTHLSLDTPENPDTAPAGTTSCKFWGLGSDGTVGANKNSIKIIGDHTDMFAQAYFDYDSKKSGGVTVSHLRFGKSPIHSTYLVNKADFVACHNPAYIGKFDLVEDLKPGGTLLINCQWDAEELEKRLPAKDKRFIAENNINVYTINAFAIDKKLGLRGKYNLVLQSAFFKLAAIIPEDDAIKYMKDAALKSYGSKGDDIVQMNYNAIDEGATAVVKVEVPASWATADGEAAKEVITGENATLVKFVEDVVVPVSHKRGDLLPVSTFTNGYEDGHMPNGTAAFEKRGVAVMVPKWNPANCIQCNFCAYVCPHAVLRPVAMTAEELEKAPAGTESKDLIGVPGLKFVMTASVLDCTGCGSCANVCPGMKGEKALTMAPLEDTMYEQDTFNYGLNVDRKPEVAAKFAKTTVKGSQFEQPLLEFSGACGGCGETPYAKLVTQLYGDRMIIANATGCSSIWGASAPATPYTTNKEGRGPAWANSLFEDNAEYGFGMLLAQNARREHAISKVEAFAEETDDEAVKAVIKEFLDTKDNGEANKAPARALVACLESLKSDSKLLKEILDEKDVLAKKSIWAFGGDGWSYDIGFGGVDHVLASGKDINILVFNTEVYSNTGGQSSKATPTGAVAQFAAAGKEVKQKDLAGIAMSYGYVYVAQVAMGADYNQTIKAITEAESYNGPSLIVAYAPCINHGIRGGMVSAQTEIKKAVAAGYWHNFRYDPRRTAQGLNPFQLDSKEPTESYRDFIMNEVRYSALTRSFPERAENLFEKAEENAKNRYEALVERAK